MKFRKLMGRQEFVCALLCLVAFIVGAIASPYFLDARYLLDASTLYVETGLIILAMTLVILTGNIDLSVAAMTVLCGCATAKFLAAGWNPILALAAGVGLGVVLGFFNGWMVTKLKLPSFVVTLATMAGYRGIAQVMLGAGSIKFPTELTGLDYLKVPFTPIPLAPFCVGIIALLFAVVMSRTVFGKWIMSLGMNENAAFYAGVPTDRVKISVFAISGLMSGLAGIALVSRLGVARFDLARGLEVDAITAVVLGGVSIYGGKGTILGSVIALLLIMLIRTGLGVANVTAEYQLAIIGSLLILAILAGNLSEKLSRRRKQTN